MYPEYCWKVTWGWPGKLVILSASGPAFVVNNRVAQIEKTSIHCRELIILEFKGLRRFYWKILNEWLFLIPKCNYKMAVSIIAILMFEYDFHSAGNRERKFTTSQWQIQTNDSLKFSMRGEFKVQNEFWLTTCQASE